jgi:hypothetical protein
MTIQGHVNLYGYIEVGGRGYFENGITVDGASSTFWRHVHFDDTTSFGDEVEFRSPVVANIGARVTMNGGSTTRGPSSFMYSNYWGIDCPNTYWDGNLTHEGGTVNLTRTVNITEDLKIPTEVPYSPRAGSMYYSTTLNRLSLFNGVTWHHVTLIL